MLQAELRDWVEKETGGHVARADPIGAGASRGMLALDIERHGAALLELVLRHDTGDGPLSGTELDLAREAVVYRALRDTEVRIPRLLAVHPAGRALLIERVAGSDAFAALSDEGQRQALVTDYMAALADLHRLDTTKLELPGFARPADGPDHARAELALWRRVYAQRVPDGDALCAFAFRWLDENAPAAADRTSLCHGDAGPGNFLFADRRVTALLDWEFAHLGDPLDDLAWVTVRAQLLGGFGDQTAAFATWSRRARLPIVAERIEYYRALVLLRMAVSCRVGLAHAGERRMNTTVYQLLLPYLRLLLPQALARAGCGGAELPDFLAEGEREIEQSPVLRHHARPLDPLELP